MNYDVTSPNGLPAFFYPGRSSSNDGFVDPSAITSQEEQPQPTVRFYPGMHQQQAAMAEAEAQQQAQQQRQQHIIQQQQQERGSKQQQLSNASRKSVTLQQERLDMPMAYDQSEFLGDDEARRRRQASWVENLRTQEMRVQDSTPHLSSRMENFHFEPFSPQPSRSPSPEREQEQQVNKSLENGRDLDLIGSNRKASITARRKPGDAKHDTWRRRGLARDMVQCNRQEHLHISITISEDRSNDKQNNIGRLCALKDHRPRRWQKRLETRKFDLETANQHREEDPKGIDSDVYVELRFREKERDPWQNENGDSAEERPVTFQCTHCPRKFTKACNLRRHLRRHTDERRFVCNVCGIICARQNNLKRHERSHAGEKRFLCRGHLKSGDIWGCGRKFSLADTLGRHFRSEAGRMCIKPLLEEEEPAEKGRYDLNPLKNSSASIAASYA